MSGGPKVYNYCYLFITQVLEGNLTLKMLNVAHTAGVLRCLESKNEVENLIGFFSEVSGKKKLGLYDQK